MTIVLDTSAVVELLLNRTNASKIEDLIRNASQVVTSDWFRIELSNVLWKYVGAGLLEKQDALFLQSSGVQLIDHFAKMEEYEIEALSEAIRLNHSCYDMLYFSLARSSGAMLVSLDSKSVQLAEKVCVSVVQL